MVAKDRCAFFFDGRALQHFGQATAVVNVVAQNQADGIIADELFTDDEGLCQAIRTLLHSVFDIQAQFSPITE